MTIEKDPACIENTVLSYERDFGEALYAYKNAGTTAEQLVAESQTDEGADPATQEEEIRAKFDRDMNRIMVRLAESRDAMTQLLAMSNQAGDEILAQHGADSSEFAEHQRLDAEYLRLGAWLRGLIEKISADYDGRDEA